MRVPSAGPTTAGRVRAADAAVSAVVTIPVTPARQCAGAHAGVRLPRAGQPVGLE